MLGALRRPRFDIGLNCDEASVTEADRGVRLRCRLVATNRGRDALLSIEQCILCAGSRRIPLEVPGHGWRRTRLEEGGRLELPIEWSLTLAAPLRAPSGELLVVVRDDRGRKVEARCGFQFAAEQ